MNKIQSIKPLKLHWCAPESRNAFWHDKRMCTIIIRHTAIGLNLVDSPKRSEPTWLWSVGHCQLSLRVFAILCRSSYPAPHKASAQPVPSAGWSSRTAPDNLTWCPAYHRRARPVTLTKTDRRRNQSISWKTDGGKRHTFHPASHQRSSRGRHDSPRRQKLI